MILLLDTRNDKHYTGYTRADIVSQTGIVRIDLVQRKVFIKGVDNPLQYSDQYTPDELIKEGNRDALNFLCRNCGYVVFKSID